MEVISQLDASTPQGMQMIREVLLAHEFVDQYTIVWNKAKSIYRVNYAHPRYKRIVEFKSKRDSLTKTLRNIERDSTLKSLGWNVTRLSKDPR